MTEETRTFTANELKEYTEVVAKAERERCAKIAETAVGEYDLRWREHDPATPSQIAQEIRNQ